MNLTHSETVARLEDIQTELAQLRDKDHTSRSDMRRAAELAAEVTRLKDHAERLQWVHSVARDNSGKYRTVGEGDRINPYADVDDDDGRSGPLRALRSKAMSTLDRHVKAGTLRAEGAETVERLVDSGPATERSWTARWAAATGSDAYLRAFGKLVGNPTQGHLSWTSRESEAFRVVEGLRDETRAMSTTGNLGGYLLPISLDPTVLISGPGSQNPIPRIARTVTTATDSWRGVTSAGVTSAWVQENVEVTDNSPTLTQPTIPVNKSLTFVPFSYEIVEDGLDFMPQLANLLNDGYEQLIAAAFVNGTGIGQPKGFISTLSGVGTSVVSSSGTDVLAASDIYNLQDQLPPRFQAQSQWAGSLTTFNTARQFQTTNGSLVFPELRNDRPTLLSKPVNEVSNMTGPITGGQENYVLVIGDWSQFLIVNRVGASVELVPQLFGQTRNFPTGQRGALLYARIGSDVLLPNAFRVLNVT